MLRVSVDAQLYRGHEIDLTRVSIAHNSAGRMSGPTRRDIGISANSCVSGACNGKNCHLCHKYHAVGDSHLHVCAGPCHCHLCRKACWMQPHHLQLSQSVGIVSCFNLLVEA
jgi:hypothetical protein